MGRKEGNIEFSAQGRDHGAGPGRTDATGYCAGRARQYGRGRTWGEAVSQRCPTHARACATQAFTRALAVGGGQMHLIAFVIEGTQIRKIIDHIGVDS